MLHVGDKFKFRIALTERCQASCPHCFNAGDRRGREMDAAKLFRFLEHNAKLPSQAPENYVSRVYIMGGEPSLHSDFARVTAGLGKYFGAKSIFSNGMDLGSWLHKVKFGRRDSLVLNGYTVDLDDPFLRKAPRQTCFYFVAAPHTLGGLEARIDKVFRENLGGVVLSIDTTRDLRLPDERGLVLAWRKLASRYSGRGLLFGMDHCIPFCLRDKGMPKLLSELSGGEDFSGCGRPRYAYRTGCMGLIKANFDLMYCNQTPMKVTNIFDGARPRTFQEICDSLAVARNRKLECLTRHDPACGRCARLKECLGACIKHQAVTSAQWAEGESRW